MQNTFEQITALLNRLEQALNANTLPTIEKDIVLEKLRKIYEQVKIGKPTSEVDETVNETQNYGNYQGLTEDVDLFFDTDHESYGTVSISEIAEEERLRKIEEERKRVEAEQQRIAEEQRRKAEEERLRKIEEERKRAKAEQQRIAEEQRRKAEEERLRKIEEERKRAEAEQQRIAEEQRRKAEEERLRKIEEERKRAKAEQQRIAEEQRRKAEEEKKNNQSVEDDILLFGIKNNTPAHASKISTQPIQRSLNDLFNEQREDHSLSAQYQRSKVTDLTKAISINDKFNYIRELFNNKGEEFSAAINQLNQFQSMEQAFNYLEDLKQKFYWDSTSTSYLSLCDLLRRKFN